MHLIHWIIPNIIHYPFTVVAKSNAWREYLFL